MRLQRAALTGKYITIHQAVEEEDVSDILYHDDVKVAEEEEAEAKKLQLKIHARS